MAPTQIISPMCYKGQSSTLALPTTRTASRSCSTPSFGTNGEASKQVASILKPGQWTS